VNQLEREEYVLKSSIWVVYVEVGDTKYYDKEWIRVNARRSTIFSIKSTLFIIVINLFCYL
jgi:hypothetical protein